MKRISRILLTVTMCVLLLCGLCMNHYAKAEYRWYSKGKEEGVFKIDTPEKLMQLAELVNGDGSTGESFEGQTILLTDDLDLSDIEWTPIGSNNFTWPPPYFSLPFSGIFDGQGHTITGLNIHSEGSKQALFGYAVNAEIRNLTVSGEISANTYCAGFVAYGNNVKIENCINEVDVLSYGGSIGGMVGYGDDLTIINCENRGRITSAGIVGGIVGEAHNSVVQNSGNSGDITYAASVEYAKSMGGIGGAVVRDSFMSDVWNTGTVTAGDEAYNTGGLAGHFSGGAFRCRNSGEVSGGMFVGGLFGRSEAPKKGFVSHCCNYGNVTGINKVGGLSGNHDGDFVNSLQTGSVSAQQETAGAITANARENENCYYLQGCVSIAGQTAENSESWSTGLTAGQLSSGEAAYFLDKGENLDRTYYWGQGEDTPVLSESSEEAIYKLNISCEGEGRVLAEKYYYRAGEQVTLTVEPTEGMICRLITAEDIYSEQLASGSGSGQWSFGMPASDAAATAYFISQPDGNAEYILTLYKNDGSDEAISLTRAGGEPMALPVPEREGYIFLGWSRDGEGKIFAASEELVCEDVVLYAQWRDPEKTTVKFSWNIGNPWEEELLSAVGRPLEKEPQAPVHPPHVGKVYNFLGWYTKSTGGEKWNIEEGDVFEGLCLFAQWEEIDAFSLGTTPETAYSITTLEDLIELNKQVSDGKSYEDCYFRLDADITLDESWSSIGKDYAIFNGILDGGGHTITLDNVHEAIFHDMGKKSEVHDLNLRGTMNVAQGKTKRSNAGTISDGHVETLRNCSAQIEINVPAEAEIKNIGGFAPNVKTMENCELLAGSKITGTVSGKAAGLAAEAKKVVDCRNAGDLIMEADILGGIVGKAIGSVGGVINSTDEKGLISGCTNTGIICNTNGAASGIVAGTPNGQEVIIEECANYGLVTGTDVAAGILASYAIETMSNYNTEVTIRGCENNGDITATEGSAGGILGTSDRSPKPSLGVTIADCINRGNISGVDYVGGIAAKLDSYYAIGGMGADGRELATITECVNEGDITASGDYAGGILGANTMYGSLDMSHVENSGNVSGVNYVGGIAGYVDHAIYDNMAHDVSSSGNIKASGSYVGGLMGYGAVSNGYWNGSKIETVEGARFVNELVGDIHSVVNESSFEYREEEETEPEETPQDQEEYSAPPAEQHIAPAQSAVQPAESSTAAPEIQTPEKTPEKVPEVMPEAVPQTAVEPQPEGLPNVQPERAVTEEKEEQNASDSNATVFEVMRTAVKKNPAAAAAIAGVILLVLFAGVWNRYRRYKKDK